MKTFIVHALDEYKKAGHDKTSWTALQKYLTTKLKLHDPRPNVKTAREQIKYLCNANGIAVR